MEPTEPQDITQVDEYGDMAIAYLEGPEGKQHHIYRASSVGSCVRALVAALMGYEEHRYAQAEKLMMNAAKEGNLHEAAILDEMRTAGWVIDGSQNLLKVRVMPGVFIRGHVDGVGRNEEHGDEEFVVEAKTMSNDRFKLWQADGFAAFRKYAWQISAYMKATGLKALYVIKNRNTGEVISFIIDEPPIKWSTIRKHVMKAEVAFLRGELPPCGDDIDAGEKFFCPFVMLHDDALTSGDEGDDEDGGGGILDDVTALVVANLAEQHYDLTEKISPLKALEDRRREIGKQLEPHVQEKKVRAGSFEVTRVEMERSGVNWKRIAVEVGIEEKEAKERFTSKYSITYFKTKKLDNGH